ncbi:HNH endonuclease signature motif containing protein [Pseudomonas aeruginosa]|uniref:HNH endonuclease signature motif containing protein n=1 Tax=Pseudomonas aeruginosa TaxID=287 RepID=UPI00021207D2|nr:HNH endonuclease signature motif containing protein [Pseudomonas aeruginosa]ASA14197.1 HNH endonuclease [Pseudomonas aeruginosa]EIU3603741.1 HNH endonuclease [Pseudomonas aeruginosa]EIU3799919.1 HNH endonuclease [Pseudomonas aeruginosa]EJK6083400.1 HNH endonuclease [Pseudomonas aeruginosa]EKD5495396.1 HNH endonuclease [Pseudomonas aeruginosa]
MPRRPARICSEVGCGKPSVTGSFYCAMHKRAADERRAASARQAHKKYNARRDDSDAFYKTERWRRLSIHYRKLHPLCEECEGRGLIVESRMVDHIKAVKSHPELALSWDNLRALCWTCHNQIGEKVGLVGSGAPEQSND